MAKDKPTYEEVYSLIAQVRDFYAPYRLHPDYIINALVDAGYLELREITSQIVHLEDNSCCLDKGHRE